MAGISAGSHPFFRISPAKVADTQTFALRRGNIEGRLDIHFNHPRYEILNSRLDAAPFKTPELESFLVSISSGATPKRSDTSLYADSGVKFFRILNIEDGEIFERDLKYITNAVHTGQLDRSRLATNDVLMTITGRVGSAAIVQEDHLPANINQHIVRLRIDKNRCRPEFLAEWLNCPIGLETSNRSVSGGTRAALDYEAIRRIRVPLPDSLETQDSLLVTMNTARAERNAKLEEADALLAELNDFVLEALGISPLSKNFHRVFAVKQGDLNELQLSPSRYMPELQIFLNRLQSLPTTTKPLGAYVDINPQVDVSGLDSQELVGFIPMSAVSDGATGKYKFVGRPLEEVRKGYTPFLNGDILWAKITPCMQNGKSCIVENLPNGVGFGSTEFHVLRIKDREISKEFLLEFISQKTLRRVATYAFTGSAGQQRVPAEFLESLPFPKIPKSYQEELIKKIKAARTQAANLRSEAESGWQDAKQWFEEQLLGSPSP